tara:strand:- start:549 stop:785 length:237 start_codon:yes stop_codon:yes gene_type:complete
MDKESYYNKRSDRQKLTDSQRKVMSLETKLGEHQDEIVKLVLKQEELELENSALKKQLKLQTELSVELHSLYRGEKYG